MPIDAHRTGKWPSEPGSGPQIRTFAVRYARWMRPVLALGGLGRRRVRVELSDSELVVRAGIWFRATIARTSIRAVEHQGNAWWAIGVHTDFRGRWLVNGSPRGIVVVHLDPVIRARAAGLSVKVKRLALSLENPDGFVTAAAPPTAAVTPTH